MTVRYEPKNFEIYKPSAVEFRESGKTYEVILDNQLSVKLDRRSDVVGQLKLGMDEKVLSTTFKDGSYFVVDNQVIDYRTSQDLKFTHSKESIQEMINHLGMIAKGNNIMMSNIMSELQCDALNSAAGGLFDVKVGFSWSPFQTDVESVIEMIRQVCSNGAIASDPVVNHSIPIINMWHENLKVGNDILVHQFNKLILPRIQALPNERISMYDVLSLRSLINKLSDTKELNHHQQNNLKNLYESLDSLVTADVSSIKKNLLQFIPAPISAFDAFNIATECATHYVASDKTDRMAQAFANNLLFNGDRTEKISLDLANLVADTQTFMDVDRAFFGHTAH